MQSYVDQRGFAGVSTLLARRGRVIHFEQVGWQDRESHTPLAADTIYRIYSMTKPIIVTAFMTLFEEGRFQLYDPVARYLPAFGQVRVLTQIPGSEVHEEDLVRPITLLDLLTHTAGLSYGGENLPVDELYRQARLLSDAERSLEAMIAELARLPLAFQPGTRWHYSLAIDVVAQLIQVISGQPLQEFLKERLFTPLGLTDTRFSVPPEKKDRLATLYGLPDPGTHAARQIDEARTPGQTERLEVEAWYPSTNTHSWARGGHGLFSTAADYLRFAQMLLNRGELDGARILAPKIVDLMHMNHLPPALLPYVLAGVPARGKGFGLGSRVLLNVAESGLPGSVGEYGWSGAARTYYWVDPQEELIGILMTQYLDAVDRPEKDFQTLAYQAMVA